jgi:hypothetical protein
VSGLLPPFILRVYEEKNIRSKSKYVTRPAASSAS